ncbi:dedicator of cytokinesis protein 7-like [Tubulanus polymorphus]|uniref:dedicator of cytokinesis protein 7-like n=1 Tax=Tubulanus polymorphus TaxID=672921 RepID=UPI003DA449A8
MASGQRAFAQKLNKQGAAEVRRQVSSAYLKDSSYAKEIPKSISGVSIASSVSIPLCDVVKPLDYEDYIQQNQVTIDKDPMKDLVGFPADDIEVTLLPKQCRTIAPIIPERGYENDVHVRDCIHCYTADYTVVNRRYFNHSSSYADFDREDEKTEFLKQIPSQEFEIDNEYDSEDEDDENRKSTMEDTPRGSWASSIFDLRNSQADPLLPNLLDRIPPDKVDQYNAEERQMERHKELFPLFPPQDEEEWVERRVMGEVPREHFGHRVLIKCLQLKLELEIEPIFASMALYDAKEKKKISENFYFDMNPEHIRNMIDGQVSYSDLSSLSRSAIFSITYPSPDIFIVIKLEKVLQQGDIGECADPYMKDDKNREKVKANAELFCEKLGRYRMPFAWTAVHLFNVVTGTGTMEREASTEREPIATNSLDRRSSLIEKQLENFRRKGRSDEFNHRGSFERSRNGGSDKRNSWPADDYSQILESFRPVTITVSSFFKQESDKLSEEDLYKFLADLKRPTSVLKKLKCIPGILKLDISAAAENPKYCLTPELYKIDPYPNDDKTRPIKEVIEFAPREVYEPFSTYRNLFYLYPKYLNFANRAGSARNIAVKVQFMCGEEEQHAMRVLFGKSSCPEFCKELYTPVLYHNKSPEFYEEMKIKLPGYLNDGHHILFTFYHISCQRKMETTPTELVIGYTWLPVLQDGRLFVGEFTLPVSTEKPPPSYSVIHPDQVDSHSMKWVDGRKPIFTVSVEAASSIHTLDVSIDRFLLLCHTAEEFKVPPRLSAETFEAELKLSISNLLQAAGEPLVHFLHLILDKLILLIVRPPVIAGQVGRLLKMNVGQTCFEAMAEIVRRLTILLDEKNDCHNRNNILISYIQYCAILPIPDMSSTPTSPCMVASPSPERFATIGRPSTLAIPRQFQRSNSDPDLSNSNPGSPETDYSGYIAKADRSGSMRQTHDPLYIPKIHGKKLVHEEIALLWVMSNGTARQLSLENAWFFFELMTKSMAEHLARTDKLYMPRKCRFPTRFMDDITSLLTMITKDIVDRYLKDVTMIKNLNTALAFFVQDLFSFVDRGYVFQVIKDYYRTLSAKILTLGDATPLILLRLDFMRLVCSHEHYVALNLPMSSPLVTPSAPASPSPSLTSIASQISFMSTTTTCGTVNKALFAELSNEFRQQHFLVGLILSDLANALETNVSNIHNKAVNVIRNMVSSHDSDKRYKDPACRARVASLYLPLIGIVVDALPQLFDPTIDLKPRISQAIDEDGGINKSVAMAIAGYGVGGGSDIRVDPCSDCQKPKRSSLNQEDTRNLLISFIWVLKNVDQRVLLHWWAEMEPSKLHQILEILFLCVSNFEYKVMTLHDLHDKMLSFMGVRKNKQIPLQVLRNMSVDEIMLPADRRSGRMINRSWSSNSLREEYMVPWYTANKKTQKQYSIQTIKKSTDMKNRLEEAIMGTGSARSQMMARTKSSSSQSQFYDQNPPSPNIDSNRLRWRKEQTQWRQSDQSGAEQMPKPEIVIDRHVEGNLSTEVNMITLDILDLVIQIVQNNELIQTLLNSVLRVMLHSLSLNQSSTVLQHMFALQRSLVSKFPELLFEDETEQCADLCLRLLKHCSSSISNTRSQASASLYLLMRQNFEIGNNFARVKMQVTMSLSRLVGKNQKNFNEEYLRKSLKTMLTYAEEDIELQDTSFPEQVKDLIFNLHMILSDTVKMKEYMEDPEMLLDLMYRIAKGYQNSPDLRLTWLQNMAGKHSEKGNHAEAAQCLIHAAGLVAEYLNMLEDRPYLPVGCVAFQKVSSNVLEESAVSDDVVSPDGEGICTGKYFTESGLIGLMEQAASSLSMATQYEAMNQVYKVLIPIHESNHDFKRLSIIHGKLLDAFNQIIKQEGKRMFGTYFRVGLYGTKFGDLDGEEFIYKEPSITKLVEISHRLEGFYGEKFGADKLVMIKDSNNVEREKLDANKNYIQITYVEPYFDTSELRERTTYFDKNYNIKRFMYATPFTLDGRAHGELHEQHKRKTLLTTCNAFPYVKTRLAVIAKEQIILTPIEVAIEDVMKKTRELAIALAQEPPDPKMLQMVLQGCIGTTVNQGPIEVAQIFLSDMAEGRVAPTKHHNKLRLSFKDFLRRCSDALHKNKDLIGQNQKEYQREMERNYNNVKEQLGPLIASLNGTATIKRSKHIHRRDSRASDRSDSSHGSRRKHHSTGRLSTMIQ